MSEKVCSEESCDRGAVTRGYCHSCYNRKRRRGELPRLREYGGKAATCVVGDCKGPAVAREMCPTHYEKWRHEKQKAAREVALLNESDDDSASRVPLEEKGDDD